MPAAAALPHSGCARQRDSSGGSGRRRWRGRQRRRPAWWRCRGGGGAGGGGSRGCRGGSKAGGRGAPATAATELTARGWCRCLPGSQTVDPQSHTVGMLAYQAVDTGQEVQGAGSAQAYQACRVWAQVPDSVVPGCAAGCDSQDSGGSMQLLSTTPAGLSLSPPARCSSRPPVHPCHRLAPAPAPTPLTRSTSDQLTKANA